LANHANLLIQLKINNTPLTIIAVHPPVPASPKMAVENQASFKLWETQRASYGKNLIIVGDFNNTPWTPSFQQLVKQTDLRDSTIGFGLQPTWPLFLAPLGVKSKMQNANGLLQQINLLFTSNLFRIPIDHALVSPNIQILSRSVGPSTGSDHLPLTVRFQIAK
jgi:endonuclease/exonuclease/phosphatase (EEP) superfamily protein YafD